MTSTDERLFFAILTELSARGRLADTRAFIQHGDTSVLLHSAAVAYYSLTLARALRLPVRARALIRGALLHDYFLYDWHVSDPANAGHAWRHPGRALNNARRDYALDDVEADVIQKHMFPLTLIPPRCREALLVCLTDKALSLYETFRRGAYPELSGMLARSAAFAA